jgi:acetyl esterase/lipase
MRLPRLAVLLLLVQSGCSPVTVLNGLAPRAGITITRDIAYEPGPRHTLDVYAPRPAAAPAPVLVFFYGGNWDSGDKAMYRFVGAALAARGILVVIPDYRLYPEIRFPAFMHDAAQAVAWVHVNIARYGGDAGRLFFIGHSAGGQIATLLALDPSYLRSAGLPPDHAVCGVIGLAGPYDFLPLYSAELRDIFGTPQQQQLSQPINFVSAQAPPMLLLAGQDDRTVDPGNTLRLAAKLRAAGGNVQATLYPNLGHKTLIAAFARPLGFLAPARAAVVRFIAAHCSRA